MSGPPEFVLAPLILAPLVLASASQSRARALRAAGVTFKAVPAHLDESLLKIETQRRGGSAADCALALAEAKARAVAALKPAALVLGADQMLDCEGRWFDKPASLEDAADHLRRLSGRRHTLPTALVAIHGGQRVWSHLETPALTVRPLSEPFIKSYLARAGAEVCSSVGAYQLEGLGAQLFERIEGDFFTVLGLPLLPLLAFLRGRGIVPA